MHITQNKILGESGITELSCEPMSLCSFSSLQSKYYSIEYLRKWSSKWVPSYCWSAEGLIADPIKTYLLSDAIILQDSYDLFRWSGGIALRCAPSYSSIYCQQYSRSTWPAHHNPLLSYKRLERILVSGIDRIDDTLVFPLLWHRDHSNYWHFTFDIAFRLFYLLQVHPYLIDKIKIIVIGQNSLKPFQEQLLSAILGSSPAIRFISKAVKCNRVIYIPPVQTLLPRQDWLMQYALHVKHAFRSRIKDLSTSGGFRTDGLNEGSSRLYIRRGNAANPRFLYNEAEVASLLEQYGFSDIDPGSLTLADQVNLFDVANSVLGLHGSAFVNMMYMRPGARVVELTSQNYDPFHDFLLARQMSLEFQKLCTQKAHANYEYHTPFDADLSMIQRAICVGMID